MNYMLCILFGYLIGSIPNALIIGKVFFHKDIRQYGSGNLGGSNAGRVLGKKIGFLVIVLDVLKAIVPVVITKCYFGPSYALALGMMIPFGHCYPIFANFKGGKAVASSFGFIGAITLCDGWHNFFWILIVPLMVLFFVVKLTKYVSLGSMTSFFVAVLTSYFMQSDCLFTLSIIILWLFIVYRHRTNIKKLFHHSENKITWM